MSLVNPQDIRDLAAQVKTLRQTIANLSPDGDDYYCVPEAHVSIGLASLDTAIANFELAACHQANAISTGGTL